MLILLLVLLVSFCSGEPCTIKDGKFLSCKEIDQRQLYIQLFKYEEQFKVSSVSLEILDSNYTTIEHFAKPNFKNVVISQLKISRCSVTNISELAFKEVAQNLIGIDLSYNNIEDVSFAAVFKLPSFRLNLTGNRIKTIDLNMIQVKTAILSSNLISSIVGSRQFMTYDFLDLSYNKLETFNETGLNVFPEILDLSYNSLNLIQLNVVKWGYSRGRKILKLSGNNLLSKSLSKYDVKCNEIYLNSIPNSRISVTKFVMSNSSIPVLNTSYVDLNKVSAPNMDFSNSMLNDIETVFFKGKDLKELRLDNNKIHVVKANYFRGLSVDNLLNLSHSEVKSIEKGAFQGLYRNYRYYDLLLDLSHNLLNSPEHICGPTKIDVSYNNFSELDLNVFNNCSNLMFLNMSHSNIRSLKSGTFSIMKKLNILDMRNNEIRIISAGIFNFSNIVTLYLQNNKIESIQAKAFNNMYRINIINLANNNIQSVPEEGFSFLPVIKEINLSDNKITILNNNAFLNLSVQQLHLNGNKIKYIKSKAFSGLNNMMTLNFSNMGITYLEPQSFYNLANLRAIDLSKNMLSSIENHTFYDLPQIILIRLNENQIQVIEPFAFSNLNLFAEIDLSSNKIRKLYENSFYFIKAHYIYLQNNNLTEPFNIAVSTQITELKLSYDGTIAKYFIDNFYLKKLIFQNSTITKLSKDCFTGLFRLEELRFNDSIIYEVEEGAFNSLYYLEYLDVQNIFKYTRVISKNLFNDLKNLKTLNFSYAGISNIENTAFVGLNKLQRLILSENNLTTIQSDMFIGLENSLTFLDVSFNKIEYIEKSAFDLLVQLNTLHLNSNYLKTVPILTSPKLNYLYLQDNSISELPLNSLELPKLVTLHLHNNKISKIVNTFFSSLSNLNELRLDKNSLSTLSFGVFQGLDSLERLNISYNMYMFSYTAATHYAIRELSHLGYLNVAATGWGRSGVDDFNIITDLPYLSQFKIERNDFNCYNLFTLLQSLDKKRINYIPDHPVYNTSNIAGITCSYN